MSPSPVPASLSLLLPEREAAALRAYEAAFRAEYVRVYDAAALARLPEGERPLRLLFWSRLAHTAGFAARERVKQGR